jgi:lipopolysaccharide/colanic/teichoic acid biosynthesis glycosyltransferase
LATSAVNPSESASGPAAWSSQAPTRTVEEVACRMLDLTVALLLLVALAPVMLAVALAVRLDSPGPALFRQRRYGRGLAPFTVHKFRSMRDGVSQEVHREFVASLIAGVRPIGSEGEPRFKLSSDERVTRVGRFLRRSSLDELPQLWDVLRGDMSLVGPRPALAYEVDNYPTDWFRRFAVKPGITGLWQVSGRSELTMEEMVRLDIDYAERRSFGLNLRILLRTVPTVLSGRGAS